MRNLILIVAVVALAGCGLNPSGKTASPSPSPLPSGVTNLQPSDEPLAPGRYAARLFEPRVIFEADGPWVAVQMVDGFFDIQQDVDSPDVIAVQFARPTAIHGADGPQEPTDAADAVALIGDNPDLDVVETDTSRIGGLDASRVMIENTGDERANFMGLPPGTIALPPERRIWIAFFDTDDGLLAIMISGSIERWDDALTAAEPVVESIEIVPGGG